MFDPTEDYLNIVSAEEQMGQVAQKREKVLEQAQSEMKGSSIKASCKLPIN